MPIAQSLLPEFDHEMQSTRKLLECVPDGKFGYKPHEKSMTLGADISELPENIGCEFALRGQVIVIRVLISQS